MKKYPHDKLRPTPKKVTDAIDKDDPYAVRAALTPRQVRFCEEYCIDFDGSAAALRAGYTGPAGQTAVNLMKNLGVQYLINHISQERAESIVTVDPEFIIRELVAVTQKPGVRDSDKLRGLELLAKHLGMFVERREISGPDGDAIKMKQVHDELNDFTSKLRRIAEREGPGRTVTLIDPGSEG